MNLPDDIKLILNDPNLSKDTKEKIVNFISTFTIRKATTFSGPLPPPEILKNYNDIVQNGAERIISMAEKQSIHRMMLEEHAIKEELKQSRNGQFFGFFLGVFGLSLATILAMYGHETIAGIFGTTTILGLVTVFVLGKKAQIKELSDKNL